MIWTPDTAERLKKTAGPVVKRNKPESPFQKSKSVQETYARSLRAVAREVARLIRGYNPTDLISVEQLRRALRQYSEIIGPWALHVVNDIVRAVENQDDAAWRRHSKQMSTALRNEIENFDTGETLRELMAEQVNLIRSIPLEAAERVHELVTENLLQNARAPEIAAKIMQTEQVTLSRATLIARTEIARAASKLTEARAKSVGSEGYIWRTSKDLTVRKGHRVMEGRFCKWAEPPEVNEGTEQRPRMMKVHAGQIWNCRCWPEVVLPDIEF